MELGGLSWSLMPCVGWLLHPSNQNAPKPQVLFSVLCVQFSTGIHVLVPVLSLAITLWSSSLILAAPAEQSQGTVV